MPQPKHGILIQEGDKWIFQQGHTLKPNNQKKRTQIPLPSKIMDIERLIDSRKLSKGWQNSKTVLQNITSAKTFPFVARHAAFMHTTDPQQLTNESIRLKLNKSTESEIIGFS